MHSVVIFGVIAQVFSYSKAVYPRILTNQGKFYFHLSFFYLNYSETCQNPCQRVERWVPLDDVAADLGYDFGTDKHIQIGWPNQYVR